MKILIALILALTIVTNDGTVKSDEYPKAPTVERAETYTGQTFELALITSFGTVYDMSYNQRAWEGLEKYAKERNISHKYYQPEGFDNYSYLSAIDQAVMCGAKVIVAPGFLLEVPVYLAQDLYPDVKFILVDGNPHNEDYSIFHTADNTVGITFAVEEAGFLAGYAAVLEGMKGFGFFGGMAVPEVVRFGYGYIQGVEYAAQELVFADDSLTLNYLYTGGFSATPKAQEIATSLYFKSKIDVIFACGGAVVKSVIAAAKKTDKKVIGVDIDQSFESPTVITSAIKELGNSVYDCISGYYDGKFPGGQNIIFSAKDNGVGLPMETSRFEKFSKADYDAIYAKLKDGSIKLLLDTDAYDNQINIDDIPLKAVKLQYYLNSYKYNYDIGELEAIFSYYADDMN